MVNLDILRICSTLDGGWICWGYLQDQWRDNAVLFYIGKVCCQWAFSRFCWDIWLKSFGF